MGTLVVAGILLFTGCEKKMSEREKLSYREQGAEISRMTYEKLSGTLVEKMQAGGIPEALGYCNAAAQDLTLEMAEEHRVSIKRTSLMTRNQLNAPDEEELRILNLYRSEKEAGRFPEAIVEIDAGGNPHYYAPILLEKKCLPCHGRVGIEVPQAVDSMIRSYYPDDRAVGFRENDLRGIWSIGFLEN